MKNSIISFFLILSFCYVLSSKNPCKIIKQKKIDPDVPHQVLNHSIATTIEDCCQHCFENNSCTYFHYLNAVIPLCIQYKSDMKFNELIENSFMMFNYDFSLNFQIAS